ncbi:MAG TPA: sterol desaturase family protein, partial [Kofleriaceae bacterium]|nr:sterol desaturase family protein [Kofleriaceae bacterium]
MTPAMIFVPVIAICLAVAFLQFGASLAVGLTAFFAGVLAWTFAEYWLHRLVFHLPVRGPRTQKIYFIFHGVHHDYPWDTTRLVMPPVLSIGLGVVFYILFRAALP